KLQPLARSRMMPAAILAAVLAAGPLPGAHAATAPSGSSAAVAGSVEAEACPWQGKRRDYTLITLEPTGRAGDVRGCGRVVPAWSPFGVATTRDGHVIYDIELALEGVDRPRGASGGAYVAWAMSSDLKDVHRIGIVEAGKVRGHVWYNQYVVAVTLEAEIGRASC